MSASAVTATHPVGGYDTPAKPSPRRLLGLYLLLGFSAGLPFYMFNAVLTLRLSRHGVDIVIIGFFAWIALLPTFKFAWAPLIERYDVPGFARFWGRRRGWIMLSQLGIFLSMVPMAFTSSDKSLPLTALFAILLAFWTTTLEVAADGWRIELAPTQAEQAPIVAANLWGYRSAMVAAGSGAILVAAWADWTLAYLAIAIAAFAPFPILASMRPEREGTGGRAQALVAGIFASLFVIFAATLFTAAVGWVLLSAAQGAGLSAKTNVTPIVLAIALLPFVALALALPSIRRLPAEALSNMSIFAAPYVELFWRYGTPVLAVLAFVSLYRMGDVLTLTLSHPLWNDKGYSLHQIGVADGVVALSASMAGVALGGWLSTRLSLGWTLGIGAVTAAAGNWIYVWLWHSELSAFALYTSVAVDQFGNGYAGAVFVIYLSMLVSPKYPGAQYALLSGFAFLLPRLLAGASGSMQTQIGYDGFFLLSGALSFAAIFLLPVIVRVKGRAPT